ncbi:MAG: PQQ-binding-like beta-propeller repeat protein [Phycisphaerae bacterium]|nr:PQQ-binding-like beta-propeller repeat protein [Phycisphaerae bacterium]
MRSTIPAIVLASCLGWAGAATAAGGEDAAALLDKTESRGGLCLVIGAKDTSLAAALAAKSALYVQVLQPDAKLAGEWGAAFAKSDFGDREKIGVRRAGFDPAHYGTSLFNLVVVEDAAALGKAKLADLCRILVPNGVVAIRKAPEGFAAEAKDLKMAAVEIGAFPSAFKKPLVPVEWKLPVALKWSAGPRGGFNTNFSGFTCGSGKFFYRERMESKGDLAVAQSQLFARDACNGRTLWSLEEPAGWWFNGGYGCRRGLKADDKGRLFVTTGAGKFVCLDAETGKQRFELMDKGATPFGDSPLFQIYNDQYLMAFGKIFSAENGKMLWALPPAQRLPEWSAGGQLAVIKDAIYFCDGKALTVRGLADGQVVKTIPLTDVPAGVYRGISSCNDYVMLFIAGGVSAVDRASGKVLWTYAGTGYRLVGDKLLFTGRKNTGPSGSRCEIVVTRVDLATGKVEVENKQFEHRAYYGCPDGSTNPLSFGDYLVFPDLHINTTTMELTSVGMPHVACAVGFIQYKDLGLIFNVASRKSGPITAVGPADLAVPEGPGWTRLQKFGPAPASQPTAEGDWPMFRGNAARGNAVKATLGEKPVKAWEAQVGLSGKSYGVMSSERTGLTQPVAAYGLVVVSDMDAQRVVALSAADGKEKWAFHAGSRVDLSPTLYNGLCLFAARDGWVYCLDAKTGGLVWKNLVPSVERYIGGHEQLESIRPASLNVVVENGLGYVDAIAFKPETGELEAAPKKAPAGRRLAINRDLVDLGNSIPRTHEDNVGIVFADGRARGRVIAFDDSLSVAYNFWGSGERWDNKGPLHLFAVADAPKPNTQIWKSQPIELVTDDIVLTPQYAYCVGHYQRVAKEPELWVVAREDGKVVNTISVEGFPAFLGMSAAGNRLFVATREGKLICYEGGK